MDLQRAYNVIIEIELDEIDFSISEKLDEFLSLFKESMVTNGSPIDIDIRLNDFFNNLKDSYTSNYSYSNAQILEELGGGDFFGEHLRNKIIQLLSSNFNPSNVIKEFENFLERRKTFLTKIKTLSSTLKDLGFKAYFVEEEFELGIIIPSDDRFNNLKSFEKIIHEWNFIIKVFNEIINKDNSEIKIHRIVSGSFQIFINESFEVADYMLKLIGKISALYFTLQGIMANLNALKDSKILKKELPSFEEIKKEKVADEIESIKKELLSKYGKDLEDGRKNELAIGLEKSLKLIIKQVNNGIIIEVNPPYLQAPEEVDPLDSEEDANSKKEGQKKFNDFSKKIGSIEKASKSLKSLVDIAQGGFKLLEENNGDQEIENDISNDNL